MNWSRFPGSRFGDKAGEQCPGGSTEIIGPLRVPLNPEDEMGMRVVGILTAFNCFDHSVLRAAGDHAETIARNPDGLMMTGVDGKTEKSILFRGFLTGDNLA
jgi:hypothetical protein